MKHHINKVDYHLCPLFQLWHCVSQFCHGTACYIAGSVMCNSVLINLPASTIATLQHVQNTAVHLVLGLNCRAHITLALRQLHWLPVY